jgi:hypothetical protein
MKTLKNLKITKKNLFFLKKNQIYYKKKFFLTQKTLLYIFFYFCPSSEHMPREYFTIMPLLLSQFYRFPICHFSTFINFFLLQTGKAPYYVGSAQTLPRGHVYSDQSKGSIGMLFMFLYSVMRCLLIFAPNSISF